MHIEICQFKKSMDYLTKALTKFSEKKLKNIEILADNITCLGILEYEQGSYFKAKSKFDKALNILKTHKI